MHYPWEPLLRNTLEEILPAMEAYLVELSIRPGKVQLFIDRDPHITIDDCAAIHRTLVHRLNRHFPFSDDFELEVSSPGIDQPLKVLRQYKKNIGRTVDVVLWSGSKCTGVLLHADDEKLLIEEHTQQGNQMVPQQLTIPFIHIKKTLVHIRF